MSDLSSRLMRDAYRRLLADRQPRRRYIVRATRSDGELDVLMATYNLAEAEACCKQPFVGYRDAYIDSDLVC